MNYNTGQINSMAAQFAEMIKSTVRAQQSAGQGGVTIAQIEADMREALRQVGKQALGLFLSSMQGTPVSTMVCRCGGSLEYQRTRPASVISVFGKVSYERAYYAGCECKQGRAPLDEQFGLQPGAVTAGLAELLALAGLEVSYDGAPKWLAKYLLFEVSENTVRSETERMGELQREQERQWIEQSRDDAYLQKRQRQAVQAVPRMYGSIDAAKVRIEARSKQGETAEKEEKW